MTRFKTRSWEDCFTSLISYLYTLNIKVDIEYRHGKDRRGRKLYIREYLACMACT